MFKKCAKTLETMRSELHTHNYTHTQQKGIVKPSTERKVLLMFWMLPLKSAIRRMCSAPRTDPTILPLFKCQPVIQSKKWLPFHLLQGISNPRIKPRFPVLPSESSGKPKKFNWFLFFIVHLPITSLYSLAMNELVCLLERHGVEWEKY